jgi:hypothetical protein
MQVTTTLVTFDAPISPAPLLTEQVWAIGVDGFESVVTE